MMIRSYPIFLLLSYLYVDKQKSMIFISLSLAIMMVDLDITAVNLAITNIANDLLISMSTAQWIIDGYMIAAASLTALGGRLCDIYGSRRIFIFGLSLFTLTSLAVGLSFNGWTLLISRVLQGACIAFTFPVAMVIVREVFSKKIQGTMMGALIAIAGLSQALGPTIGGLIVHLLSWRWIFLLDVPLSLFALWIALAYLPAKQNVPRGAELVDWKSASLLSIGLLAIMTALNQMQSLGYTSMVFIGLLIAGFFVLLLFIHNEYRTERPLLALHLLMNKNFLIINTVRTLFNFIYFAMLFMLGLLLQNSFNYSSLEAGYILLVMTLTFGVLSLFSGRLIDKIGVKIPLVLGFLLLMISNGLFVFVESSSGLLFISSALFISGLAVALLLPAMGVAVLFTIDSGNNGAAMGVFTTNAFIGGALGVASAGFVLSYAGNKALQTLMGQSTVLTGINPHDLAGVSSGLLPISRLASLPVNVLERVTEVAHASFLSGFALMMGICTGLSLLSVLLILSIKGSLSKRVKM